jgi:hypothetical protein
MLIKGSMKSLNFLKIISFILQSILIRIPLFINKNYCMIYIILFDSFFIIHDFSTIKSIFFKKLLQISFFIKSRIHNQFFFYIFKMNSIVFNIQKYYFVFCFDKYFHPINKFFKEWKKGFIWEIDILQKR